MKTPALLSTLLLASAALSAGVDAKAAYARLKTLTGNWEADTKMAGNQPRMQATSYAAKKGEIRFQFLDATNLRDAKAGHMRNATFRFVDDNHMAADWEFFEGGQRKTTESFQYSRSRQ